MSTGKYVTLFASACLTLIGCAPTATVDTTAELDAIRNIEAEWTDAVRARDVDKLLGFFAPDAVTMDANAPISTGHDAIRGPLESWLADDAVSNTFVSTLEAIEVSASGDLAYTRGTHRFSQTTPNGLVEQIGKWVTVYKKIDGEWKVVVDIYNSDNPLPGQ
jgi:uncharacterized protein (TIGR02246 family)